MARKQTFPHDDDGDDDGFDLRRRPDIGPASDTDGDEGPSKSELKRQDMDLRALGVQLVELPPAELAALDLPEKLQDAVVACRRITSHGARLRQEMYIAKVMRHVEVEPIRAALARRSENDRQRVRREHGLEQWRERLLADEAEAWTALAGKIDPSELQPLRALVRQARAEQAASRPPAASRQLFRRLRELLAHTEL